MPEKVTEAVEAGAAAQKTDSLEGAAAYADALYVTRVQRERFADPAAYERCKGAYARAGALRGRAPKVP